jgi:hypothetical protein
MDTPQLQDSRSMDDQKKQLFAQERPRHHFNNKPNQIRMK